MTKEITLTSWPIPAPEKLEGKHVRIARLNPDADIDDLYEVSHAKQEYNVLWKYMHYGPFRDKKEMYEWLIGLKESTDPLFYTVFSKQLNKRVGMYAIMNVEPNDGRVELGNIWYSPLVQKTIVNSEATFLFLSYLFDELKYRRVEWKCDDENEASKYAAVRLGFSYEGLFRQHMVVKGKNRDTAWFAMLDSEWPERKGDFERYFANPGLSLTKLHGKQEHSLPKDQQ
ncbi:MAG: GNAT family N-acetyltransferase [Bacteroidetes bacterium]|nr:GNAT family N-acetyltransferase [Bacteroidota bacterium]MCW5895438.1 GNAT family N-acetyltransferase [Bacteroidota bacterium]